jgi:hypothetical protein
MLVFGDVNTWVLMIGILVLMVLYWIIKFIASIVTGG